VATDPYGPYFISYDRSRTTDIAVLREALLHRGVPALLDAAGLPAEQTRDEVARIIAEPRTAGAILYVSPEVQHSSTVREIEVPAIVRRKQEDPSFKIITVAAGGVSYKGVREAYGAAGAFDYFSGCNVRVQSDPLSKADGERIANAALRERLAAIADASTPDAPLAVVVNTREPLPWQPGVALQIDWSCCFEGRHCCPDTWDAELLPAAHDVRAALQAARRGRDVTASGLLGLPAALAFGYAFASSGSMAVDWIPSGGSERWSVVTETSQREVTASLQGGDRAVSDLLLLVSSSPDVRDNVKRLAGFLPPVRAVVDVSVSTGHISAADASTIARKVRADLLYARTEHCADGTLHVVVAGPVGLAFVIGQVLNTFPRVQTYEHIAGENPSCRAAVTLVA
jgi:hypothetical protein